MKRTSKAGSAKFHFHGISHAACTLGMMLLALCVVSCGSIFASNASIAESGVFIDQPIVEDRPIPTKSAEDVQADFQELFKTNEDLVGWLELGESISLPIVQLDNVFYLDHDYYGKEDEAGTVFINEANIIWPADKNLLFHGHNMRSGACFGNLDDFRDVEYLKKYPIVTFRTVFDEEASAYVPVALFDASMDEGSSGYFDIGQITFESDDEFVAFAKACIEHSLISTPFDVQADDDLITLITCSYSHDNGRYMIVCRSLRADETIETVTEEMQKATAK